MSEQSLNGFTPKEVEDLRKGFPEHIATLPNGQTVVTISKAELLALADLYPTHFAAPPGVRRGATEEETLLRVKYPSMFKE
jgi:hypothetical protein